MATKHTTAELVDLIKAHATDHYNDGGWDVVVECLDDEQIAATIGKATTFNGALKAFATSIDVWADREADARNSAF